MAHFGVACTSRTSRSDPPFGWRPVRCRAQVQPMHEIDTVAIVGLGKIGAALALRAKDCGLNVVGCDPKGASDELIRAGVDVVRSVEDALSRLRPPRVALLYVPAGPAVDELIGELSAAFQPGDVIVDGGNSYWGDSVRRERSLRDRGIAFVDAGTSGGQAGARSGPCYMVGGRPEAVARVEPMLRRLAAPDAFAYAGPPGAGHFRQARPQRHRVRHAPGDRRGHRSAGAPLEELRIADVLECWRHGSVIRTDLIDSMAEAYRGDPGLKGVPSHVEDTGEVNWLISDALALESPIPVIAQAVMQLLASRDEAGVAARAVAVMRKGFGGHPLGKNAMLRRYRETSRVGDFVRADSGAPEALGAETSGGQTERRGREASSKRITRHCSDLS